MTSRRHLWTLAFAGIALGAFLVTLPVHAVNTRTFVLDTNADLSAGVLDRVSVTADGSVVPGAALTRVGLPDGVTSVWSLLDLGGGAMLAGTGVDGRVYRVEHGTASLYAETGSVVVTSLTRADDGTVYAGTLPDGKLFRLRPPVGGHATAPELVVALPGVQHIWAVLWDHTRGVVLCATGPEGKLFAVDPTGRATVVFDSEEPHLMTLTPGFHGEVLVGAGGGHAVVYAVEGPGHARVLARLAGDEVKGIAVAGEDIAAASNEFTEPPEPPHRTLAQTRTVATSAPTTARPHPGHGNLYRIHPGGSMERVYTNADAHITAVAWDAGRREILAGLGVNGRIVAVAEDRSARVAFDVDEHQVTAIGRLGTAMVFATGDSGAVYLVGEGVPTGATWNSKVLDAGSPSRWGAVRSRGTGAMEWSSRSGNADTPDALWSPWEPLAADGGIRSPTGRYVQVRAQMGSDPATVLRSVTVYYLPVNARAVLTEVTGAPGETKAGEARSTIVKLGWKVDNPDADTLRYRLRYRSDEDLSWRPVARNQDWVSTLTYDWPTEGLPEGYYRVEVEASDEVSNPPEDVLRDRRLSEPLLVDNTAPVVTAAVTNGGVHGEAVDGVSAVTRVELSMDGGEWHPVHATDGVFDSRREGFEGAVETAPGDHTVAVRAYDEAGNAGVTNVRYRVVGRAPSPSTRP